MEFEIKEFEEGKEYEKIQAELYSAAIAEYGGAPIKEEDIKQRNEYYKKQEMTKRNQKYAFDKEGKPLAYLQYQVYNFGEEENVFIGYPWSIPECPPEVQEVLFDDLFKEMTEKFPTDEIFMGYIDSKFIKAHEFAKAHGFEQDDFSIMYSMNMKKIASVETPSFSSRVFNEDDIDLLVEIGLKDKDIKQQFDEKGMKSYFTDRVFKHSMGIILLKEDEIIGATAPLRDFTQGQETLARFVALSEGYEQFLPELLIHLARYCGEKGTDDQNLIINLPKDRIFKNEFVEKADIVEKRRIIRYRKKLVEKVTDFKN